MTSQISHYSKRTVWIHWVSTLLIFILFYTGINMEHIVVSEHKFLLYRVHFIIGTLVFILTITRIVSLFRDERPGNLYPIKSTREKFRKFVYNGFYILISWMCVSGIISLGVEGILPSLQSGNWKDLPEITANGLSIIMLSHHILVKFIFLLLIFHITGFLAHLIQKKENTLRRIWFK